MQPDGPYRFTHILGTCQVGKAWAAIDAQGRFVTVAVLDAVVANDPRWREAYSAMANVLAQGPGGQAYTYADFSAPAPWVAYPAEAGPGAEKLLRALGVEYHPVSPGPDAPAPVSAPSRPVSSQPASTPPHPVSGAPHPTSAPPHAPWAVQAGPMPEQREASTPNPVSAAPSWDAPTTVTPAQPVASAPLSPAAQPAAAPYDPFSAQAPRIRPSEPPKRRAGVWMGVAALILVVALGTGAAVWVLAPGESAQPGPTPTVGPSAFPNGAAVNPGLKPWAQAAPYSPEERALAIAAPAMVFIEAVFTGVLRETKSNVPLSATPITFKRRCTGFVVNASGQALTNGQCVRPAEDATRERALYTLGRILIEQKKLTASGLDQYVRTRMATTSFTGNEPGTEPTNEVFGQLNVARGDLTADPAAPVEVVRVLPVDNGNLALVKLTQTNVPAVELNTEATLGSGTSLLVLGYSTTDTDFRAATYTLQSKSVQVAGTANQGAVAVARINGDVGIYSHGGIAVDTSGRVVGVLDNDRAANGGANRALVPIQVVTGLLGEAGVQGGLADPDRVYRSGLDAFFAGRDAEAISRFDTVTKSSPTNLLAQAYRQNAVDRARLAGEEPESSRLPAALLAGLAAALLAGLVVAVVVLSRRRSGR
ncbi:MULTISPECIES: trypsin-like peptidase domain-containing protein [unclassified Micromonospora]|uniref:trypsin-like peptidase domain-containing protein n=1 Tax=unclassified Micromonospora TaxID=2617518 RepID=UPI001788AE67|nr:MULTISPECIES: trypsin-like peptidase domain-containing protein [unclassified Micromonospora]WSG04572.1 trypsin-like peptidase domain-containing protein [Micromonospora sp. NBC_01740]